MTQYSHNFEGGTNGATVTTGNSGGASGDSFDAVAAPAGTTLIYDNTHPAHGTLGLKGATGSTSAAAYSQKNFPAATSTAALRFYCYLTANPAVATAIATIVSGTVTIARVRVSALGKLQIIDANNAAVLTQTGSIPLNQLFRVEVQFSSLSATVGAATLSRYDTADSTTASETGSVTGQNFGGTGDRYRIGIPATLANAGPIWFDDVAGNDTGTAIGPLKQAHGSGSLTAATGISGTGHARHHYGGTITAATSGSATGHAIRHGVVTHTTAGTLAGSGIAIRRSAGALSCSAALSGGGTSSRVGTGSLTGAATLTGHGHGTGHGTLTATTSITGSGTSRRHGTGLVTCTATLTGSGVAHRRASVTYTAVGSLSGSGRATRRTVVTATATTSVTLHGHGIHHGSGAVTGVTSLTGSGHPIVQVVFDLTDCTTSLAWHADQPALATFSGEPYLAFSAAVPTFEGT